MSNGNARELALYSKEAFELLSREWIKLGWNQKYSYTFSWMGRPVIQLPEDLVRLQEVIYRLRPDVIVETGVAHGGSLIFHASLCKTLSKGRVIGIDVEIRPQNRKAIETHPLSSFVTLVEGNSIDPSVVAQVNAQVASGETVLVILDSCHTKKHVLSELEAYCGLVTPGSYLLVADGIMEDLSEVPRGQPNWVWDHPAAAVAEFLECHAEFVMEEPKWLFNESDLSKNVSYFRRGWLRRRISRADE